MRQTLPRNEVEELSEQLFAAAWGVFAVGMALVSGWLAVRSCTSRLPALPAWAGGYRWLTGQPLTGEWLTLCRLLGQHQQWFLFDQPSRVSVWFETIGHTTDGSVVCLFPPGGGQPPSLSHHLFVCDPPDTAQGLSSPRARWLYHRSHPPGPPWSLQQQNLGRTCAARKSTQPPASKLLRRPGTKSS